MSGHNKWSKIKRTKGVADIKRGKLFTKLLREIEVAARMGGGDPRSNPRLRDALAEARANNMPKDNLERAIKRGLGEIEGKQYEQVTYEGYGPGGAALLMEGLTDNRNRTVADIRAILTRNQASLGEAGSVAWMFEKKGQIILAKNAVPEDILMEVALEAGAEDIQTEDDSVAVYTPPEKLDTVRTALEKKGMALIGSSFTFLPKNSVLLNQEAGDAMLTLIDLLEDLDDIQKVHSNFQLE